MVRARRGITALTATPPHSPITVVAETGSTNADVLRGGHGVSLTEGQWIVADRQRAGRGRLGRQWHDGNGNFMGSTLVLVQPADPPAHGLALIAALAVTDAIAATAGAGKHTALPVQIKWPNDIMTGDAKMGGILLERVGDKVAVGIGINLVHAPSVDGRQVAALSDIAPQVSRDIFAVAVQAAFSARLTSWRGGDWPERVLAQWLSLAHPQGTPLSISEGTHAGLTGTFDGLEQDGSLRLRRDDGTVTVIRAGEVQLAAPG